MLRAAHINNGEMGFKYVSPEMVALIGYRHDFMYVTPLFDTTGGVKLRQFCDLLFDITDCPILLKKIHQKAFEQVPIVQTMHNYLPLEDDTCPETVLHFQKLFINADGDINPIAKKLARRARSFEQKNITFRIIEDITELPFEKLRRFIAADKEKYASYLPIVKYLYTQKPNQYKYRVMVFLHRGRIKGLYMLEVLSITEYGLYGGITSKDIGGITEWMDIYVFKQLFLQGVRVLHLGGSESRGIAEYINKLIPHRPSYFVQTLLYEPHAKNNDIAVQLRLAEETDFMTLAELYRDFYNSLDELGETWTKESAHRLISHFYHRQPDLFFVAEFNGRVIGAIVAAIQPWWDGNRLVEGEVFIDSEYHATNLNKQLVRVLLTHARDDYQAVAWDTLTPTSSKHPLGQYEQFGFTDVPQWAAISGDVHVALEKLGI
ncbi:MAG TPA: GNAT family N-acetyltransferase [Candidatus Saccharimonadales bacterium]|nr:GNAT family N-acetyltransferase [Candidatus Saccharimonadales bacterium]